MILYSGSILDLVSYLRRRFDFLEIVHFHISHVGLIGVASSSSQKIKAGRTEPCASEFNAVFVP